MSDYVQGQMVSAANAQERKRKADAEKLVADGVAAEEARRLQRAMDNKAGAGRGDQGKPASKLKYRAGGTVSSASKRADGIAQRGKTRA